MFPWEAVDLSPLVDRNGFEEPPVREVPSLLSMLRVRRNTFKAGSMVGRFVEMIPAAISIAVQPTVGARV
jgi:hypothetical protein